MNLRAALNRRWLCSFLPWAAACWMALCPAKADDGFALQDGDRVVFFGDSISQNGLYIAYAEAYVRTRFPDLDVQFVNHGISSETISGTTEIDHDPPRPWALPRFERDITNWQPTRVVACFGMNDGNYHPFDEERFEKYQAGMHELIRRTRDEAHARLTLLTPPPYDAYRRQPADPQARYYGYKFPALDYDATLEHYSAWLTTLPAEDALVADVHSASNAHLAARRRDLVSFSLAPDAVHPGPFGHWLMAQTLLEAWQAPSLVAELVLDAQALSAAGGNVEDFRREGDAWELVWHAPLPLPRDPEWESESVAVERLSERLDRYTLRIDNLPQGDYELSANGAPLGRFSAADLAAGLDLTALRELPSNVQAQEVLRLVRSRRQALYMAWRENLKLPPGEQSFTETDPPDGPTLAEIQALCRRCTLRLRLAGIAANR